MKHFWRKPGKTLIYVLSLFMTIGLLGIPVYAQGTEDVDNPTGNESNQPVTDTNGNDETNTVTNGQNQGTDTTGQTGGQTKDATTGSIKAAIPSSFTELTNYLAKQENARKLTIDIYQVATAEKDPNYDSYPFDIEGSVFNIPDKFDLNQMGKKNDDGTFSEDRSDWEELAQTLAGQVKSSTTITEPFRTYVYGAAESAKADVPYGLYLVLARGTDLTAKADYFKDLVPEPEFETDVPSSILCTIMESDTKMFYFTPFLVAVPNKLSPIDKDSKITTTDANPWVPDVTVYLKPSSKPLYGSLVINKVVQELNDRHIGSNPITPVTAVFRITGWKSSEKKADEKVYSNVASITIPTGSPVTVDHIPVGTYVEVTEEYTGAGYKRVLADGEETILHAVIPGPDESPAEATFTFKDTYDDELKKGYGIMNTFTKTETDNWSWKNDAGQSSASTAPASSEPAEGGTQG